MVNKMFSASVILALFFFVSYVSLQGPGSGTNGNLRLCIVEGRGSFKRAPKYCPILDQENCGVECVIGTDRLDCLRRISKGTVDFGVFSPEDLVAAQWAEIDVLVTNELRLRDRPFERSVVAVVNRRILPEYSSTLHAVLRNTTLCHPGTGVDDIRPLSDTLNGYLESLVLEHSCEPNITLVENQLKALAGFFGKACKPGPWVLENKRDKQLKRQYPSLCAACDNPGRCSTNDLYWGDSGALACLGEGAGDITWAELDDVTTYFGTKGGTAHATTQHFVFLCRDGNWQTLDSAVPCVWVNRPWPIIVSKRKTAEAVSQIALSLSNSSVFVDQHWRGALAALLELREAPWPLQPPPPPMDYLAKAKGFREAYSLNGCHPPRHISLCTSTIIAKNKCEWLSESAAVYGVNPPLQCVYQPDHGCLDAVSKGSSDVTLGDADWLVKAIRDYSLTPFLHEIPSKLKQQNTIIAYVKTNSSINKMADLRGKRAAFARFDGAAWHSVKQFITKQESISCKEYVYGYFKEVCAPGIENGTEFKMDGLKNCYQSGEVNAMQSLIEGNSDVAFVSSTTFKMLEDRQNPAPWVEGIKDVSPLCPEDNTNYCFISWSNLGYVFGRKKNSEMRRQEIINVFTMLDQMFGKYTPFHRPMFAMYGSYNHELNVLFHNDTKILATDSILRTHPYDKVPKNFERSVFNITDFSCSFGGKITPSLILLLVNIAAYFYL